MKDSEQTETTVADKIANETVKDEQEVLDATTKRLKETFSEKEEDQDTADAPEEQEDPTPESKVETEADEPESKEDSTPEPDKEEKGLPEAYVRSAVHQGWTEEKVQAFFKADPEGSLEILKNIHDSNNKLTETFSNLGRKAMESTSIPGPKEKTEIKPLVDIDKLREQYDGDPLLEVIEAINKAHAEQTAILSQRPTGQAQVDPVKEQADAMIIQQVDNFW
ncbi:MAG TPA: hypothetical protein VMW50_08155, partial [Dehalococcoidia bacterium]|nr:hypothetical protein [Dehalococcoidia bacterium]